MKELKDFLDRKVVQYNRPEFIQADPISIPHRFTRRQDIEIMGFWAAVLAWGQRKTIISKSLELVSLMDGAPYDFVRHHSEHELKRFLSFRHRTFNAMDALYFLAFFRHYYSEHDSLEDAFLVPDSAAHVGAGLVRFHELFFSLEDYPERTRKHVATPARNSACKRMNMFLRWMVRRDACGVDFGIWRRINPSQLICPCDVHVDRVARKLGLIQRRQTDWMMALELTAALRQLDPEDPVKYDFALFGLGVEREI